MMKSMSLAARLLLAALLVWSGQALAQPFPAPVEELCRTPEGRQTYIDNLNEATLWDLKSSVEGMQANGSEVTYDQALAELVAGTCNDKPRDAQPSYTFRFDPTDLKDPFLNAVALSPGYRCSSNSPTAMIRITDPSAKWRRR